ncbi:MAG: hypothetical protein H6Q73_1686 [Firmicutes bacterium]|nr:hypothetical protein [Bacillota bacterium]
MNLEKLREAKPTLRWKTSQYPYSEEVISQCEIALEEFIRNLDTLGDPLKSQDILRCVQAVVVKFNKLDAIYSFIETVEREDLCDFIYIAARMAGLDTDEDITEKWRDW